MENGDVIRRPLKTRQSKWAAKIALWVGAHGVRPNQISLLSIVCALIAGICFIAVDFQNAPRTKILFLIIAAVFIQLRLLCNLLDGMVAVEGGFRSKAGEVFNDLPDRISDALIFVAAGYSMGKLPYGIELGWLSAVLSIMTAYVRVLGGSCGVKQDFCGPMAKPHRMATMTIACILAAAEIGLGWAPRVLLLGLGVVALGSLITTIRRVARLIRALETK